MSKRIYIAATRQNDGKTTISLGLISALLERGYRVGYMKPVGQRVVQSGDAVVDEDVLLVQGIFGLRGKLQDNSPIGIPKGFTEQYIRGEIESDLPQRIMESFERVSAECDVVILEGTGHAGVGSVIDLSNAAVAHMLDAQVLIVSLGGIGRPYDEVALNSALFREKGDDILGVIINKVLPAKRDKIRETLEIAFQRRNMPLLGAIPTVELLSGPTLGQVLEDIGAKLLSSADDFSHAVTNVVIGTTKPDFVASHFKGPTLLITSGDRDDLIEIALKFAKQSHPEGELVGMLLTNGLLPNPALMATIERTKVPVLGIGTPSYSAAYKIHDLLVKIRPTDHEKIEIVRDLIRDNVNIDKVIERLGL